jgi:hypothetical protein
MNVRLIHTSCREPDGNSEVAVPRAG